jgi:hypothetical protein
LSGEALAEEGMERLLVGIGRLGRRRALGLAVAHGPVKRFVQAVGRQGPAPASACPVSGSTKTVARAIREAPAGGKKSITLSDDGDRGAGRLLLIVRPMTRGVVSQWYAASFKAGPGRWSRSGHIPLWAWPMLGGSYDPPVLCD